MSPHPTATVQPSGRAPRPRATVEPRRGAPARLRAAFALAFLVAATPLAADSLQWALISAGGGGDGERALARAAQDGYRVQAVVFDAPEPLILVVRPCCGRPRHGDVPPDYRVVGRRAATAAVRGDQAAAGGDPLAALGDGHRLIDFAPDHLGGALAVFETAAPGRRYASLVGDIAEEALATAADRLAGDGYACVGGAGRTLSAPDWLLFEQAARDADAPREARLVTANGAEPFVQAINQLAGEGWEVDCAFGRGSGRFSLLPSRQLAAVVSRPRGSVRPVAHVALDLRDPPSSSRQLLAVLAYGSEVAFLSRPGSGSAWNRQVDWPSPPETPAWEARAELERRLRARFWNPVERAWVEWSAGSPVRLVAIDRGDGPAVADTGRATRDAEPLPIPAGAEPLPAGGGEPGVAYRSLLAAIARRDLPAAKALWTGEVASRWQERVKMFKAPLGLGFSEKELFASLADEQPTDLEVLAGWVEGEVALLRVEGTVAGSRSVADVGLVRRDGRWSVAEIGSWQPLTAR